MFVEPVDSLASAELGIEPVENGLVHWNAVVSFWVVRVLADVRVALHHRANGCCRELGVVTRHGNHHREEYAVHLLFNEGKYVAVNEFCREADGVAWHAVEACFKKLVIALAAYNNGVAKTCKESFPVGKTCPEFKHARKADGFLCAVFPELRLGELGRGVVLYQKLVRALDHVRHGLHLLVDFGDEGLRLRIVRVGSDFAAFATVAGDEALAVTEGDDGAGAMVGAVLAKLAWLVVPAEGLHGFEADKACLQVRDCLALFFHELAGEECYTDSAHFARAFRTDRLKARVLFEGAEHCVVLEGTALHHNFFTEGVEVADTDNLRENVVDNGTADTCDNVFGLFAVALFRDDGTVHEHGAAGTQLGRALGLEGEFRNLFHRNAEGACVGFDERTATRGTGFVKDDARDHAVLDGDGLHVLATDIQDEGYVGAEALGSVCVCDCFHCMVVGMDGLCKELFAVTGGTHTQNVELAAVFFVAVGKFVHGALQDGQRFTVVAGVESVNHVVLFVQEHKLRGGGTGVDTEVGVNRCARSRLRVVVAGHLVVFEELLVLVFALEEEVGCCLGLVFGLTEFVEVNEGVEGAFHAVQAFLLGKHGAERKGCTHGNENLGMFRDYGLFVGDAEAFLEGADESGVKGERATFENDWRLDFHALGEATDGLLCNGVETGKGDIFLGDTVVEHRLDVCFGENAATAGNFVHLLAALGVPFEGFGLDAEELGHLVDKGSGTAGADTVHTHVTGDELARGTVLFEEHHLGVLTAQFNGHPGFRVRGTYGEGVRDDFLDKEGARGFGERLAAATAESNSKVLIWEKPVGFAQHFMDLLGLHGIVALICIMQKLGCFWVDNGNLHSSGANVDTYPQIILRNSHSGHKDSN